VKFLPQLAVANVLGKFTGQLVAESFGISVESPEQFRLKTKLNIVDGNVQFLAAPFSKSFVVRFCGFFLDDQKY